ncbi:PorV/PorQ family protein [Phaeodactylibacter sp.]|jgi:opacity protein-like surface antigen|uniref:PorV/PorQ family protein n=1 Tax=Phaeodactylibacter sp. TaxID=1940289 RepID=UPI0025DA175D|nr:PorV/PorQ family protein [Phaeodactylibacter sp.]MCI5091360.1 PorV/PorQ family protein [Phaeodactylibacter sp.]
MNKITTLLFAVALVWGVTESAFAGNPDRQGEAGAAQLLLNPWAESAGLHSMTTSFVSGVEAMRINVAGLSRINKTEVQIGHGRYLEGTDILLNGLGVSQKVGESGAIGISLMAMDFGDIPVTTTDQPGGTGSTFSPSFFNLGIGYAHTFENKISVGVLFRGVSESIADVNAFGFALDAGVQYVTGENDNFKFGIALRNIGGRMQYGGEGLTTQGPSPNNGGYELTFSQRSSDFELPSMLNIGLSYDFLITGGTHRITVLGNFTSNSFSQDQVGGGIEYSLKDLFMVRGGYRYEFGSGDAETFDDPIYTGLSAGATIAVPLGKDTPESRASRFAIDYAYRATRVWNGTHNIGVRISI